MSSLISKIQGFVRWVLCLEQPQIIDLEAQKQIEEPQSASWRSWCFEHRVAIGCALLTLTLLGAAYAYSQSQDIGRSVSPVTEPFSPQHGSLTPAPSLDRTPSINSKSTPIEPATAPPKVSQFASRLKEETTLDRAPSINSKSTPIEPAMAPQKASQLSSWLKEETTLESGDSSSPFVMFTSYTKDNSGRLEMSRDVAANHQAYAALNGLHQLTFEKNLADDALPYWSKIAGLKAMLEAPEFKDKQWFAWLDDDMVITNPAVRFDQLIDRLDPTDHLIVTEDAMSSQMEHIPLNTGFILVRNSDKSREILNAIWEKRQDINNQGYTLANCPDQSCLHEQEALSKLLPSIGSAVRIIKQRFLYGIGINTFSRFSHYDASRDMHLNYNGDPDYSKWVPGDFMAQCTGLATWGNRLLKSGEYSVLRENLRQKCIDQLIGKPPS